MRIPKLSTVALASLLALAAPAQAAPTKVWVSKSGADGPSCGDVAAPCATFQQAHNVVARGGEIGVLTPGDYGTVSVEQSVNITNDGSGEASILAGNIDAVVIFAGNGDIVSLRGLVIDGQETGAVGIAIFQVSAVHVQNCVIRNFEQAGSGYGITLNPSNNTQLFVSDSIIFNNGSGAGTAGVFIRPGATGSANVVLDRVHLENNVVGLWVDGTNSTGNGTHLVIRDSVVSGNAGDGIYAVSASGKAPAFVFAERTSVVNNVAAGILANGPRATYLLHGNVVARNGTGIGAGNGGQLISYGTNKVNNNLGTDGIPTGTYSPL